MDFAVQAGWRQLVKRTLRVRDYATVKAMGPEGFGIKNFKKKTQ
jgi:hypothetical protein